MLFTNRNGYTHILAGLGNPGPAYMKTRHNVGYMTVDLIMSKLGAEYRKTQFHSLIGEIKLGDNRILVMKPETFMNNSGLAIGEAASFYKIPSENVIIISDDINLPVGKMRIRKSGSAGGHNGLKSIIAHLNSDNFPRIRIGVGAKQIGEDLADHVLEEIPKSEMEIMKKCAENCVDAVGLIADGKADNAMNKYN